MTAVQTAKRIPLDDYAAVIGTGELEELRALARPLLGRNVEMVNSTFVGGGVAEILNRLIPLAEDLGLSFRWDVITGGEDFFAVTKAFHNALHGAPYHPQPRDFEIFREYQQRNLHRLPLDAEFVVIHDPQPVGLIDDRTIGKNHWVWRCHIDLSHPNSAVWEFLESYVSRYDGAIFSSPEVLARHQIDPLRPILTQISRFDRLKDPLGVIRAYRIVKRYFDCQLVLAGGSASDDPEGTLVLKEVHQEAEGEADIKVLELPAWAPLEVNALQRASSIVIQKSLREGFGLTVSEALWKKKPVVASAVGGIPTQVIHNHTGLLAHSVEGTAYQIRFLLSHPEIATRLGERGHQHVKENFLITQNLKRYLTLFLFLGGAAHTSG
jgi:trehalose synthase